MSVQITLKLFGQEDTKNQGSIWMRNQLMCKKVFMPLQQQGKGKERAGRITEGAVLGFSYYEFWVSLANTVGLLMSCGLLSYAVDWAWQRRETEEGRTDPTREARAEEERTGRATVRGRLGEGGPIYRCNLLRSALEEESERVSFQRHIARPGWSRN